MTKLSLVLDSSLQSWEQVYFHDLGTRLGAEVHFPSADVSKSKIALHAPMWIISRRWREWARLYAAPGVYFSPLGPYFGNINFFHHLKVKLSKNKVAGHILTHSELSYRFYTEVDKREGAEVTRLELPFLELKGTLTPPTEETSGILRVGVLSDFDPESNLNAVCSVAHYVRRKNSHIQFLVRGQGGLIKHFTDQVRELGLQQTVSFEGTQSLTQCDLLLHLPVRNEHFISVYQAASVGIPLIVHETNGIEKFVRDGSSGFLVPMHDTKSAGELILRFADDMQLRKGLGQRLRATCMAQQMTSQREEELRKFFQTPAQVPHAA